MNQEKPGPLKGLKVLDFTWVYAGPFATRQLADMGADVVKIDRFIIGAVERHYYIQMVRNGVNQSSYSTSLNRGKRSMSVNFKSDEGRKLMLEMAKKADVVMENMSPGTMAKLGLGYEDLRKVNPGIIYCSISCFGQYGPRSQEVGYDIIAQSASGWTGQGDQVFQAPLAIGDCNSSIHATTAVLAALYCREKTGIGQYIDISMVDCLFHLHEANPPAYLFSNRQVMPRRIKNWHPTFAPYGLYKGKDGYMAIGAISEDTWQCLVKVMGSKYQFLLTDSRTDTLKIRLTEENAPYVHQITEQWLMEQESVVDAEKRLKEGCVPCMRVKGWVEVADDPHTRAREMIVKMKQPFVGEIETYGSPFKMSETFTGVTGYAPLIGEHNSLALTDWLNLGDDKIRNLYEKGALYKEDAVDWLQDELKRLGIEQKK